ncbi:MAG: hypothetical protein HOP07_02620 [Bacteriovoracaceae bacterium]|nr:hypothetical protein [Bacteriovoracaceae bacterium]
MKSVLLFLVTSIILSGCKGYIGDSTVISGLSAKKCTMNYILAPNLKIEFNLIDSNYKSQSISLNGSEIITECTSYHDCERPYFTRKKGVNNLINYNIYDEKYEGLTELNIKLVTTYYDDSVVTVNRENEVLNFVATTHSNCQETKTANIQISDQN